MRTQMHAIHKSGIGLLTTLLLAIAPASVLADDLTPRVLDDDFRLEKFAEHPQIVTPIGAMFDKAGRLLVIESQTHHRKGNYEGPETDRIRIVEDTNGDGRADNFRSFYEGTEFTMSLAQGAGDWIYVATRKEVFRIADRNDDDQAEVREPIARLETSGNYPHNGLCGLAFDSKGRLVFGIGENLGADYKLIGTDGTTHQGSGEGGVFRCEADGSKLERLATGFWNPFGICIDSHDRIFAVGNDPDGSPPCRLLHVGETGDYGFQFRYGRSGKHPLQAWNGELPGTLPMIAGTGEAPSEMVIYQGRLWVASWGHHRIERYELIPQGASFTARREIVVQGDENFRPVGLAIAPDGSLFVTDWVDKSYPVHGKGRLWRLTPMSKPTNTVSLPPLSEAEQQARQASESPNLNALCTDDRFLRQATVAGLARSRTLAEVDLSQLEDPRQKLGVIQALRWRSEHIERNSEVVLPLATLSTALEDPDARVRLIAVRWIADAKIVSLREAVAKQLERADGLTPQLYLASIATLEILDTGKSSFDPKNREKYLLETVADDAKPAELRAISLRMIDPDNERLREGLLQRLASHKDPFLQREGIRSLALSSQPSRNEHLSSVVRNASIDQQTRADAVMGLATTTDQHAKLLETLVSSEKGAVAEEAARTVARTNMPPTGGDHPPVEIIDLWIARVGSGGNADAGWRVFFGNNGARCARCHRFDGRGADTGPDLTGIGARMSRRRVLESILQPSREIAPQYVPSMIQTTDGRVLQGLWQGYDDAKNRERFVAADGTLFEVDPTTIESRKAASVSIMPDGLHKQLSLEEIRDLLALLSS